MGTMEKVLDALLEELAEKLAKKLGKSKGTPIRSLNLPPVYKVRAIRALEKLGISSIEEISSVPKAKLVNQWWIGEGCYNAIVAAAREKGVAYE